MFRLETGISHTNKQNYEHKWKMEAVCFLLHANAHIPH